MKAVCLALALLVLPMAGVLMMGTDMHIDSTFDLNIFKCKP